MVVWRFATSYFSSRAFCLYYRSGKSHQNTNRFRYSFRKAGKGGRIVENVGQELEKQMMDSSVRSDNSQKEGAKILLM